MRAPDRDYRSVADWVTYLMGEQFTPIFDAPNPRQTRISLPGAHRVWEVWQALFFAHAYSLANDVDGFQFAFEEREDSPADIYFKWRAGLRDIVHPVQLKELPPEDLNKSENLERILASAIARYDRSRDLILAVFLNRDAPTGRSIDIPGHNLFELWLWGWSRPNPASEIMLFGPGGVVHYVPSDPRWLTGVEDPET